MIRTLLATGGLALGAALSAPMAHADTAEFNDYLARNGVDTSTPELAQTSYNLGKAVCDLFSAHADAGDSGAVARHHAMDVLTADGTTTNAEAATWVVESVDYLCPQYVSMLP
jgi:hypothetical protein